MLERADLVLASIPVLAVSGLVVRTAIGITGVATGLLAAPLAPLGYLAAFSVVLHELLRGPAATKAATERT